MSYLELAKKIQAEIKVPTATDVPTDPTEGDIIAVLIFSHVLEAEIWFALRDDFQREPGDNRAVFHASELPFLRTKTPEQLHATHTVKMTMPQAGGRMRK